MSEMHIGTRGDLGRVTRILAGHPEWHYSTRCGAGGTIVIEVDDEPAPEPAPGEVIAWLRSPAGEAWSERRINDARANEDGTWSRGPVRNRIGHGTDAIMPGVFSVEEQPSEQEFDQRAAEWHPGMAVL